MYHNKNNNNFLGILFPMKTSKIQNENSILDRFNILHQRKANMIAPLMHNFCNAMYHSPKKTLFRVQDPQ